MLAVHFNTMSFCFYLNLICKILEILDSKLSPLACVLLSLAFAI
jgi:hypothetical protein